MAAQVYAQHIIIGNVDYTPCSTDNNCVSISIDFGENADVVTCCHEEEEDDSCYEEEDDLHKTYTATITGKVKWEPKHPQQHTSTKNMINRARMIRSERDTSHKQFTALKSRSSFFSVLKFETGAVIVVGLQDPALTGLCVANAVTDIADTLKYPIKVRNVSIVNTVSTF
uniref:Putative TATA-box bind protein n=1 Tax=Chionoecetes opilio bacilliform virus TaxID=1825681 RepID=A0A1Q3DLH5_9VIRU|nr:putative TATA-box bind protein [Chionoecetes opilio bacilliform virus]